MTVERRPIATRELGISKRIATAMAGMGWTPNGISIAGMIAGILAGFAFWLTTVQSNLMWLWFLVGAALVQLRLLANMLDGMVAVEQKLTSPLGELYNEVPDRVSDVATLVGFAYAAASWPLAGWIAAVLAVSTAYVRAAIKAAGGPQDFVGPMAKPHRMFLVTLTALYCGLAPAAWQPMLCDAYGLPAICLLVIALGSFCTFMRRLLRGARALRRAV